MLSLHSLHEGRGFSNKKKEITHVVKEGFNKIKSNPSLFEASIFQLQVAVVVLHHN